MTSVVVIGSGPAGVSVAKGLLERGCAVTLIDVGNTLEVDKQVLLHNIQKQAGIAEIDALCYSANGKEKLKLPYGSNFIYETVNEHFAYDIQSGYFNPSFAQGGLSNVWGGVLAEYSAKELMDWPQDCRDLSHYYRTIIRWFDQYYQADTESVLSAQASYLKNQWDVHQDTLCDHGFSFSTAQLAVDFNRCCFCRLCQYGCPYGLIYHSTLHLELLKKQLHFTYIQGMVVENFSEKNNYVTVIVKNIKDGHSSAIDCDRLFVACGAGLSSLLYLRALNKPNHTVYLKDSQHFMLPCLVNKKMNGVMQSSSHALCQLKFSVAHEKIAHYPVYLQLYTYMKLFEEEVKSKLKLLYPMAKPWIKPWLARLVVMQGYLDVRESNHLAVQYQPSGKWTIKADQIKPVAIIIDSLLRHLKQNSHYLALKPLGFLLSKSLVGQSNHVSGSLPMSELPQGDETDIWGRPNFFKKIHFVDGSILPSMPAGPVTLTMMANAYRIGKECPL